MTKEETKVVEKEHNCNCGGDCHKDCQVNQYNKKLINVLIFLTVINMILLTTSIVFMVTNFNSNCNVKEVEKTPTEKEENNEEDVTEEKEETKDEEGTDVRVAEDIINEDMVEEPVENVTGDTVVENS